MGFSVVFSYINVIYFVLIHPSSHLHPSYSSLAGPLLPQIANPPTAFCYEVTGIPLLCSFLPLLSTKIFSSSLLFIYEIHTHEERERERERGFNLDSVRESMWCLSFWSSLSLAFWLSFETGSLYTVLNDLMLTTETRLTLNSQRFSYLCLPSSGKKGMHHHARLSLAYFI